MAREIAAARPEWSALLVDLRLHGDSPALDPPHTVEAAAADVRAVIEAESSNGAPVRALLGHSFGGKVTLAVAATPPRSAPSNLGDRRQLPAPASRPEAPGTC